MKRIVSGDEFQSIMKGVYQTIDGEFAAFRNEETQPWLVIKAIDSTLFEVWSRTPESVELLRNHFSTVKNIPSENFA